MLWEAIVVLSDYVLEQNNEYISVAVVIAVLEEYQRKVNYCGNDGDITSENIKNYIFSYPMPDINKNYFNTVIRFLNRHKFHKIIGGYYFDHYTGLYKNINEGKTCSFNDLYTQEDLLELLRINPNASIDGDDNGAIIGKFLSKCTHTYVRKSELVSFQPFIDAHVSGLFDNNVPYVLQDKEILISPKHEIPHEEYKELFDANRELNEELEKLKAELLEKDKRIIELESIQTTQAKSKLGTREENNITKVLAVLADMEKKIDLSKPYEAHGVMLKKAELLGIDRFPSNESVKKWFSRANECKKS